MKDHRHRAEHELIELLIKLKKENKVLDTPEFISVLNQMKSVAINKGLIKTTIKTIKLLAQTQLKNNAMLTKREKEVLTLIGQGHKNTRMAEQLKISKSTIETHRKNIRKKLKLTGTENLFSYALLFSLTYYTITDDNLQTITI